MRKPATSCSQDAKSSSAYWARVCCPSSEAAAASRFAPCAKAICGADTWCWAKPTTGHFVVHRILTVGDERVTLLGDGNTVGTETIPRERIYGIVDCGRLHLWLAERWMRLRPLRRYPLAILRRICRK